jgi:transcription initiation factor TFIID subunit TAF12
LQTSTASGRGKSPINDAANSDVAAASLFPPTWDQQQQQQQQHQQPSAANNTYESAMAAANIPKMFMFGPNGVHVLVTDEVLANVKDESLFALQMHNGKLLMKAVYKAAEM